MTFLPRPCFLLVIVFGFVPIRFWESVAKENLVFFRPLYLFCFRPQLIQFIHIINVCYQYEAAGIFTCTPIRVLDRPFYRAVVILTRSFAYKKSCSNHCFSLWIRSLVNNNRNMYCRSMLFCSFAVSLLCCITALCCPSLFSGLRKILTRAGPCEQIEVGHSHPINSTYISIARSVTMYGIIRLDSRRFYLRYADKLKFHFIGEHLLQPLTGHRLRSYARKCFKDSNLLHIH